MGGSDLLSKSVVFAGSNLSWSRETSPEERVPIGFRCSCQLLGALVRWREVGGGNSLSNSMVFAGSNLP